MARIFGFHTMRTVFQPLLFGLRGKEIDFDLLDLRIVGLGVRCLAVSLSVRPRSHIPVFDRPFADRTGESATWNLKTSPVLTGRSNDRAVVHAQRYAKDRNSIISLFLLYRRRKRRRNGLHWVHPEIKTKRKNSVPFTHYLVNYDMTQTGSLIIFECLCHLSTRCIAV
jgi:hypothetical protein